MSFSAKMYKVGINPCIDIPNTISSKLQRKAGYIPVQGTINGFAFLANLVPVKNSPYRLYINLPMRQGTKVSVGDTVTVTLAYDVTKHLVPMPNDLEKALAKNAKAKAIWDGLPQSRQKEIKRYINNLKTEESVQKNIKKLIEKWDKSL